MFTRSVKKVTNNAMLIEVLKMIPTDKILKWTTFDILKIKTYSYKYWNSSSSVVRSPKFSVLQMK